VYKERIEPEFYGGLPLSIIESEDKKLTISGSITGGVV
jgi:hypothetical protein